MCCKARWVDREIEMFYRTIRRPSFFAPRFGQDMQWPGFTLVSGGTESTKWSEERYYCWNTHRTMKALWHSSFLTEIQWTGSKKEYEQIVNCPTRQSLLLFIGSLHWLSSWRWWPSIKGGRLYQPLWRPEMGDLTHFFCKSHKLHISRWRILFLPSCIWCISPSNTCILRTYHEFPKMGVTYSNPHFRKFVNFRKLGLLIVTLIFGNSWISENGGYL